jgi:hypothetical protein
VIYTSSTLGVISQIYSVSGIFDPNTTGTGHQPMLMDIFAQVYNRYTVLGSRV